MADLTLTQAQGIYTEALAAVYRDRPKPTLFLQGFFPAEMYPTLLVGILVQRGKEKVAVDVFRGDSGNRATWSKSTQKLWETAYFRLGFDVTKLQLYEKMFSGLGANADFFAAWIKDVVDHQMELRDTITRAIELMCKQVLEDGVIINSGTKTVYDFKRRAASMVDLGAGNYWTVDTADPFAQIEVGCNYIRTKGKAQGGTYNLILGDGSKAALYKNKIFLARQNLFNMKLDTLHVPNRYGDGAVLHGQMSCGNYLVNVWTYPEFFDDANGFSQPYITTDLGILLPENTQFITAFGAVPQIMDGPGGKTVVPVMGDYIFSDYLDTDKRAHYYDVESCPLPIPVSIDRIWTVQTLAR